MPFARITHNLYKIVSAVLAVCVLSIAGIIEVLNFRAGGYLPRHDEFYNDDPAQGFVTWRYSPLTSDKVWLRIRGPRTPDGAPLNRPLTPDEHSHMEREVKSGRANNALLDAVTVGTLQYLLVPGLFLLALGRWRAEPCKAWTVSQLVIAIVAAFLMFYRGYFTSLGR